MQIEALLRVDLVPRGAVLWEKEKVAPSLLTQQKQSL